MMGIVQIGSLDKIAVKTLADKYGLKRFAVFGSFARGEERPDSDLDLLVEWKYPPNISRYMRLIGDVEKASGRHVDLTSEDALFPYLKDSILSDAKDLL